MTPGTCNDATGARVNTIVKWMSRGLTFEHNSCTMVHANELLKVKVFQNCFFFGVTAKLCYCNQFLCFDVQVICLSNCRNCIFPLFLLLFRKRLPNMTYQLPQQEHQWSEMKKHHKVMPGTTCLTYHFVNVHMCRQVTSHQEYDSCALLHIEN